MNRREYRCTMRLFGTMMRKMQGDSPIWASPARIVNGRTEEDSWNSLLLRTFNAIPGLCAGIYRPHRSVLPRLFCNRRRSGTSYDSEE